ncbi:MAG: hypothetical protein B6242_01875 [Anaerolineaceae bacterium 4572_78]|nr:MAG: hypothetical protein B6242_01875 [Anaerolineaceae bacterium 4572_78]
MLEGILKMIKFDIFSNYICPYAYRASLWVHQLKEHFGDEIQFAFRHFSLMQNRFSDGTWQIWNQPQENENWQTEKYAFEIHLCRAIEAVRRQGHDNFDKFHVALFEARHNNPKRDLKNDEAIRRVAEKIGVDMAQFKADIHDSMILKQVGIDHLHAVEELGVFGTPTFVFTACEPMYLKLERRLSMKESLDFWDVFYQTVAKHPYVLEMKRPN